MELHERHHREQTELIGVSYQSGGYAHHRPEEEDFPAENNNKHHHRISWRDGFRPATGIPLLLVFCLVLYVFSTDHVTERPLSTRDSCVEADDILALKKTSTIEELEYGAVAADHPVCSEVGASILRDEGGNAVDAAVATALCLGVANPASSGIGGGAFILIHSDMASHTEKTGSSGYVSPDFVDARDKDDVELEKQHGTKVTEVIDCREVAPAASTTKMFVGLPKKASEVGGLAVAIPGELRGLELAHARHGRLSWGAVVEPAEKLARDGVPVGTHLAGDIAHHMGDKDVRKVLTKNGDTVTPLEEGDILKQPALADTLRAVMEHGADAVYKGSRGEAIAKDVRAAGGIMTADDLARYRATLRSPLISNDVGGFTLVGVPPPSSGGAALIGAARFLAAFETPYASFADTLSQHLMTEALRHAFAIRMSLSDPAFNANVTNEAVNDLVYGSYMETLANLTLDNDTLPLSSYGGKKWAQLSDHEGQAEAINAHEGDRRRRLGSSARRRLARRFGYLEDHGTTHFNVVDKDGNAVSMTTSLNTYFGSGVWSETTGVVLNSQMDDFGTPGRPNYFGLRPSPANFIKPGKKPLSSMSPFLVFRRDNTAEASRVGNIFMALGASGGPKIISAVLQVFLNCAWLGIPLFESMANSRLHDQLLYHESATTLYEKSHLDGGQPIDTPLRTRHALEKRGHAMHSNDYMGCVQGIVVDLETNRLTAVSDIRKGGTPAGY